MPNDSEAILTLTQKLLDSIAAADWVNYEQLCDSNLTAFEPEAMGQLVEGMKFHQFYFNLEQKGSAPSNTICSPHIHLLGDVAVIAYVRLTQKIKEGVPVVSQCEETRVWQKKGGTWKHIHFHRSVPS